MIEVIGDEIVFEGTTVGRLAGGWPTLQERVRDAISGALPDNVTQEEYANWGDSEYDRGFKDAESEKEVELERLRARVDELEETNDNLRNDLREQFRPA